MHIGPGPVHYRTQSVRVSGKDQMRRTSGGDRRVQRTRAGLHRAMMALLHEKAYDDIVVKEILAHADVARSTFYAHFRDKDDLLDSGIREVLDAEAPAQSARSVGEVLGFSLPLFEHIQRHRAAASGPVDPERLAVVHERLRRELVERLNTDLGNGGWRDEELRVPPRLVAEHIAATFLLVLRFWLSSGRKVPAREANALFLALTVPLLRA